MGRGLQDVGMTLSGRIGALIAGIATQSVLAWNLGPDGRGSLAVCLLFATILVLIFSVGSDVGVVYFVSSKRLTVSEGLFYTSLLGGICSLLAMVVGWGLMQTRMSFFSHATHGAFLLSLLLIPVSLLSNVFSRLLTAVLLFKHYAAIRVLGAVLQLLMTLCFVWWLPLGVRGALMASIITAGIILVVCVAIFFRRFELALVQPSARKFAAMFSYGARYYVGKISNMANVQIGTVILAFFASQAEIGWFAIASRLTKLVELVPEALTTVLLPRMAADGAGRKDLVAKAARVVSVICGAAFLLLALGAAPIVRIVFSPDFLPAVPLIRILAIGGFVHCVAKVFLAYLIATKHPGTASIIVTMGVVVNVGLLWWLWPSMGLEAAAWAMSANYLVSSAVVIFMFPRLSGTRLRGVFSFSRSDWSEFPTILHPFTRANMIKRKA